MSALTDLQYIRSLQQTPVTSLSVTLVINGQVVPPSFSPAIATEISRTLPALLSKLERDLIQNARNVLKGEIDNLDAEIKAKRDLLSDLNRG